MAGMGWRDFIEDFIDIAFIGRIGRILLAAAAVMVALGYFTVRLALAGQWQGAGLCLFFLVLPFAIGGVVVWRNRRVALEEAERARHPLNLP
jgi:small-conductance mechanosensitive channel